MGRKPALLQSSHSQSTVTDSNNDRTCVISYTATLSAAVIGFIG